MVPMAQADPRVVGRAGIALISNDGSAAITSNPAAIARRDTTRFDMTLASTAIDQTQTAAEGRAISVAAPGQTFEAGIVAGAGRTSLGVSTSIATARVGLPQPDLTQPTPQIASQYFYRYQPFASTRTEARFAAGVAHRVGDNLALGASAGLVAVDWAATQFIWGGQSDQDGGSPQSSLLSAEYDARLSWRGKTHPRLSLAMGALAATDDGTWEFAAAMRAVAAAAGRAELEALASTPLIQVTNEPNPTMALRDAASTSATIGARYVRAKWTAEANATWSYGQTMTHSIGGLMVTSEDISGAVTTLPDRTTPASIAAGVSADWMVSEGFLWLTAGAYYRHAWAKRATDDPLDVGTATGGGGLGIEVVAEAYTIIGGVQVDHLADQSTQQILAPLVGHTLYASPTDRNTWHVTVGLSIERAW